jgi:NNP family nitrate/nitrite transporter-like MFS transporter
MSIAMAGSIKHISVYYPQNVGAVGGGIGLIAALGGFILPVLFGYVYDLTGIWTGCFVLLFVLTAIAFIWMHLVVRC